jgi:drug/metabolite transporter (DMT)-like permease
LARGRSTSNSGAISLAFAAVYLVAMRVLDKRGGRGMATPFAFAGVITLFAAISLLANDLDEVGTGFALIVAGVVLAVLGALGERRGTTWFGGAAVALGAAVLAGKAADDNTDALAVLLIAFGAAVVLLGAWLQFGGGEPAETLEGPSTFRFGGDSASPPAGPTITTF